MLAISESTVVDRVAEDFQETWDMAEEVTQLELAEMVERDRRRKLKKHESEVQGRAEAASRRSQAGRRSSSESVDEDGGETQL